MDEFNGNGSRGTYYSDNDEHDDVPPPLFVERSMDMDSSIMSSSSGKEEATSPSQPMPILNSIERVRKKLTVKPARTNRVLEKNNILWTRSDSPTPAGARGKINQISNLDET